MGRSRGGLTTTIHAVVDANGAPITLTLTPGQAHGGKSADEMLAAVKAGDTLTADAGYHSDRLGADLKRRLVKACIKPMPNRKTTCRPRGAAHARRNPAGRFFNTLKHVRAIANRFEKRVAPCLALVRPASARVWVRLMSRRPGAPHAVSDGHTVRNPNRSIR
jgi:transposase